jgi:tetratricopeptide (TPR) repeat protein
MEFRTLRRMTGSDGYLPVIADCLRALGKPREALEVAHEGLAEITDPAMLVEMRIVQAGARADLGQIDEAGRLLRRLIEKPPARTPQPVLARAYYAWAAHELALGHAEEARRGFARAAKLDPEGQTDALDRLDDLDGMVLELDEEAVLSDGEEVEELEEGEEIAETDPSTGSGPLDKLGERELDE